MAVAEAFAVGRALAVRAQGNALLGLLDDLEELLATDRSDHHYLSFLGKG